ncbi:MAG: hypothetical protein Kow0010_09880 [Dehalococcoidia bacterium]
MTLRRYHPRRAHLHGWVIALGFAAMVIAILPVAAVLITGVPGDGHRTAFAAAPPGSYVVVATSGDDHDIIAIAGVEDADFREEILRVDRLPGFASTGAVSPDGRLLALVVVDGGTLKRPEASLILVDLETADVRSLIPDIDPLQRPVWRPDSAGVVAVRSAAGASGTTVTVIEAPVDGSEPETLLSASAVLGVYPVGFDRDGALVSVRIDGKGSTVLRGAEPIAHLTEFITRDWSLSPDGSQLAFIVVDQSAGLRYVPSVVSLDKDSAVVAAQSAGSATEALGTAWAPGARSATFGVEPGSGGAASAQAAAGFDVPLEYSPEGDALAVRHWTGTSFDQPGSANLEVVTGNGRVTLDGASRFFGWAKR